MEKTVLFSIILAACVILTTIAIVVGSEFINNRQPVQTNNASLSVTVP